MLAELADVLSRPRIKDKYGITENDIEELLVLIEERSEHVLLSDDIVVCRDKDDNFVIETAIKGKSAYLVTRDDDIKFDKKVALFLSQHNVSVVSIAKFLPLIKT
ncbi:MAG: putative toxin-antitoxin system toxin component, PIN family [Nitrospirae bacterium]|nr:putative toxin-antitoxin system toxin component, PIN family [Nitrospirota bacterium]